jgi:hypothetical protein
MKMQWKTAVAVTAAVSYLSLATVSNGVFVNDPRNLVGTSTKVQPKAVLKTDAPPEPNITVAAFFVATALVVYWSLVYGPPPAPNSKALGQKNPEKMLEALP